MTFGNVLICLALIAYLLVRKVRGQPLGGPKKLLALPVLVTVVGYGDLTHAVRTPLDVTLTVTGAALSLGLGLLRGRTDKLSARDGSPFVQWGAASLILFFANVVGKLVLDLVGIAAGGTTSAVESSLVFTFGLTLLGEAVVLWLRSGSAGPFRVSGGRTTAVPSPDKTHA